MTLNAPYGQHNYMGSHAGESAALTWIRNQKFDSNKDGSGNPENGMTFYDSSANKLKVYENGAWTSAVGGAHNDLSGLQGGTTDEYYHLTSAQHIDLTDGGDCSIHKHDDIYYTETELGSTTGGSEGASLIGTDTKANLGNATNIEDALTACDTHVGTTSGNPHSVTLEEARTESNVLAGDIDMNSAGTVTGLNAPSAGSDATTKDYVDGLIQGLDWQDSVLDKDLVTAPSPTIGNRYIVAGTGGDWSGGAVNDIAICIDDQGDPADWDFETPDEGFACWVEDENVLYVFNGSNWVKFGSTISHNNTSGLQGGTTDEYYHLTSSQHTDLTDGNDCSIHKHDDIYYTETELGSTTGGSEGASLIGTDTKSNLGNATNVEDALTALDTHVGDVSIHKEFYTGAGTPNGNQAGNQGDTYLDTTNNILYVNSDGNNDGWVVC